MWDYCISLIPLFSLIGGFDSVIMHFRCKLGTSKTMLKQIANIKEFLNLLSINHQISFYLIFHLFVISYIRANAPGTVSDLRKVNGFRRFPPTIKLTTTI